MFRSGVGDGRRVPVQPTKPAVAAASDRKLRNRVSCVIEDKGHPPQFAQSIPPTLGTRKLLCPRPHRAEALSDDARLTSVCRVHRA